MVCKGGAPKDRNSGSTCGRMVGSGAVEICNKAAKAIREKMRTWDQKSKASGKLSEVATAINPMVMGWVNYYGRYHKEKLINVLKHVNLWILKWVMTKYKRFHKRKAKAAEWLRKIIDREPGLLAHWRFGEKVVFR